jgi:FtsH-binding integral membrane protein
MAFIPNTPGYQAGYASAAAVDAGLRAYMLRVYNWMASGLALTGVVATWIGNSSAIDYFYHPVANAYGGTSLAPTGLAYLVMFAPLGFVMVLSFGINRLSTTAAQGLFWAFCAVMGASLANIFLVYTGASIANAFFITAGTFAAMSIYGYTTKTDLTRFGSFLMMALFGIIIAMLVNMFLHSAAMQFAISVIGVLVFTGLTAYDTQRIKADFVAYSNNYSVDMAAKRSVYDALSLYLNFINLFLMILRLTGNQRQN